MNQPATATDPDFASMIVDSATDFAIFAVDASGNNTEPNQLHRVSSAPVLGEHE